MNQERQKRVKDSAKQVGHILKDEFTSLVFESKTPFSLAAFQAVLGRSFSKGVSRMKGTLWFAEEKSHLYSFHMSGRQRYEITPQASVGDSLLYGAAGGNWSGDRPSSHKGNAGELHCQWWSGGDAVPCNTPLYSDASALIASDPRFEVLVEQN